MKKKPFVLIIALVLLAYTVSAQGMRVKPGTSVKVETGTTLDIFTGDLLLESDVTGDASLIDLGTVSYTGGQAQVQRYLTNGTWHLISSPITNAQAGLFLDDFLQFHTESSNLYTEIPTETFSLIPMKGYALWSVEGVPSTEVFEGITNTGNKTFSFTKAGLGYNLMGNPYPSAIDWNEVTIPSNLYTSFQLWDPTIGLNGDYVYYIETGGPGNTTSQYIPSGQGFFTWATGSGTLTLTNSVRTQGTQLFYKNTTSDNEILVLKISGNNITTQTAIRFIAEATPQIDRLFDVPKIISGYPDVPNLYSFAEGKEMAINTFPSIQGYETIPISFQTGTAGNYTILATELETIPIEVPVYLEDVEMNYFQDLRANPEYTFYSATPVARAFKVHFKDVTGIESFDVSGKLAVNCFLSNNMLHINFLDKQANTYNNTITVYCITGQKMLQFQTSQPNNEIPLRGSQSVYLVKITTKEGQFSTKVFNR